MPTDDSWLSARIREVCDRVERLAREVLDEESGERDEDDRATVDDAAWTDFLADHLELIEGGDDA